MPLYPNLSAEPFGSAHVRGTVKLGEHVEMWFLHADRPIGCVTVLKHEEVAKERLWTIKVCLFSKGRLEIQGAAYRLLRSIIEIVTKGRADLGFGFDSSDQYSLANNEEIPFFGGSEETRELNGLLSENAVPRDSSLCDGVYGKGNEPVHLCTACDCATRTLIGFATCFLFFPLGSPCLPAVGDCFGVAIGYLFHNFTIIHTDINLSDLSALVQRPT